MRNIYFHNSNPLPARFPTKDRTSTLIWAIASTLAKSWRTTVTRPNVGDPFKHDGRGYIYCFWHSGLLTIAHTFRNTQKTAVVSSSRDGQRAAEVAMRWGHEIIYGSSTRGGMSALRQCTRVLQEGRSIAITPDGPRGPAEVVKPGVAQIALMSGAPVVIMRPRAQNAWRLKSWDRFIIPKPFTKLHIEVSEPIDPLPFREMDDPTESLIAEIQQRLLDA